MTSPKINPNAKPLHTSVTKQVREYLNHLAATPGLSKTQTVTELVSFAVAYFLSEKPFEKKNWTWQRPEGYYKIKGKPGETYIEEKNGDWVALHPGICDIVLEDGSQISSDDLINGLKKVAFSDKVPKLRVSDTGMSQVVFTFIMWMVSDLYPPAKFAPREQAPKMKINLAALSEKK